MNDVVRQRLAQLDRLPGLYVETPDVAGLLGWDQDTIRLHIVALSEWNELTPEEQDRKIPARRRGRKYLIPKYWVRRLLEQALDPAAP